jgi:hypothetical protein
LRYYTTYTLNESGQDSFRVVLKKRKGGSKLKPPQLVADVDRGLGRIRTGDRGLSRTPLYPLSYEPVIGPPRQAGRITAWNVAQANQSRDSKILIVLMFGDYVPSN